MQVNKGQAILIAVCAAWALMIATGLGLLWAYENEPGPAAHAPARWPADSNIDRATDRATLVLTAHPHCPCTRASIGELAKLMTQARGRVTAYVLFLKPEGYPDGWEKTDLWQSAADMPDVKVIVDERGAEARRFRAMTSGQTALYDSEGELLFSGGITGSRGHSGDNAGRSAIVSLLNVGEAERAETFVFGCPLFKSDSKCEEH
ncbi:MAG TPA: RedB protein [Blastocatellia bacterium]|nr:RedB protein [Blastocatellia bacterium]